MTSKHDLEREELHPVNLPTEHSVLVVDDDPSAAKLLLLFMEGSHYRCARAHSGKEALQLMESQHFQAIISDLRMPGISGLDLLHETRNRSPFTAFIVTTGVSDLEVALELMRSGADDYLTKPLLQSVVLTSLEKTLKKKYTERLLDDYRRHLLQLVDERTEELRKSVEDLRTNWEGTIQALGRAIDLRDQETSGHSWRVCQYSLRIASALNVSESDLRDIARAAYLHDIGKLGIPDHILLKPGPLSDTEWVMMREHTQIGFNLLKAIPFLSDAAEIVLYHHERFDGSGYPRGLKGDQIPLGARIFAVADTLDAITSNRPYHAAETFETAQARIRKLSGIQLDPAVVEAYFSFPPSTWENIERDSQHLPDSYSLFVDSQDNPAPEPKPQLFTEGELAATSLQR